MKGDWDFKRADDNGSYYLMPYHRGAFSIQYSPTSHAQEVLDFLHDRMVEVGLVVLCFGTSGKTTSSIKEVNLSLVRTSYPNLGMDRFRAICGHDAAGRRHVSLADFRECESTLSHFQVFRVDARDSRVDASCDDGIGTLRQEMFFGHGESTSWWQPLSGPSFLWQLSRSGCVMKIHKVPGGFDVRTPGDVMWCSAKGVQVMVQHQFQSDCTDFMQPTFIAGKHWQFVSGVSGANEFFCRRMFILSVHAVHVLCVK